MYADTLKTEAKNHLAAAKLARADGDDEGRLLALVKAREAAVASEDGDLVATTCWRLSKARYDLGHNALLFESLGPLIAQDYSVRNAFGVPQQQSIFDLHEPGLRALEPLTRRYWDHVGYLDERIEPLWTAWIAAQEAREEPSLAAWGAVQLSWHHAVTGRVDAVFDTMMQFAKASPKRFRQGSHRHARAADPEASLAWVQLDLARTALRAATWACAERRAWQAAEFLEDAAEDTGLDRTRDPWWLDAMCRAAERFQWKDQPPTYGAAYAALGQDARLPLTHQLRVASWQARAGGQSEVASQTALEAARTALAEHAGFEWAVESLHEAGSPEAFSEAATLKERTGVQVRGPS